MGEKKFFLKNFLFITHTLKNTEITRLKNIDLLSKLPFYKESNVAKTDKVSRR